MKDYIEDFVDEGEYEKAIEEGIKAADEGRVETLKSVKEKWRHKSYEEEIALIHEVGKRIREEGKAKEFIDSISIGTDGRMRKYWEDNKESFKKALQHDDGTVYTGVIAGK